MKTSETGIDFIKGHEQFMRRAYDDRQPKKQLKPGDKIIGVLTIGYGHTGGVKIGQVITEKAALELMAQDLIPAEKAVNEGVKVPLTQPQFDALVSFVFNCGVSAFLKSTLLKRINAKAPVADIQAQFLRWNRDNGTVLAGLTKRRQAEADMWDDEAPAPAPVPATIVATPAPVVDEDKSLKKSVDVWALTGATGLGSVTVLTQIQESLKEFQKTAESIQILGIVCTVSLAIIAGLLLYKRVKEILEAQR
jgi:lysozyme